MSSTLYRHGAIHAPSEPFAEAVLVADGVVVWLGTDDTASGLADSADEVVDLDGALVAPAFVDAHAHVLETGFVREGVDLTERGGVRSLADALDRVASAARDLPPGATLLGHGWDETSWPEGRGPTREELDRAAAGAPVYLARVDVHSAVVSTALATANNLEAEPGWASDGRVVGAAHHVARLSARAVDDRRRDALYRAALGHAAAHGIASVHEHSAPYIDTRDGLRTLLEMTRDAGSHLPLVVGYRGELCVTVDDARELLDEIPGLTGIGGDLNLDGSLGSRTAALRSPYQDDPALSAGGPAPSTGELYLTGEQVSNHVAAVTRAGVQAGFHVIGDLAMDELLLGLRAAAEVEGIEAIRAAGHRAEAAAMIDAPHLAALVLLGVRLSMQPAFDAAWGGPAGMYAARLGAGRAAALNPFADLAAAGIPLAFGSDSPITPFDPWGGVRAAVWHHQKDQRMSVQAAFRAHTRVGWRLAGLDHTGAGEIRVGTPAHLAIWRAERLTVERADGAIAAWSTDPRAGTPLLPDLDPDAPDPVCVRTVRDGVVLFDAMT
ncbi:MAG TPA: amidohydrolase family protein [Cellulomonadaceae bacterium]|nr:amidohydrolase family protein [Cellulomonadaceae bacterium]